MYTNTNPLKVSTFQTSYTSSNMGQVNSLTPTKMSRKISIEMEMEKFIHPKDQNQARRKKLDHLFGMIFFYLMTLGIFFIVVSNMDGWNVSSLQDLMESENQIKIWNFLENKMEISGGEITTSSQIKNKSLKSCGDLASFNLTEMFIPPSFSSDQGKYVLNQTRISNLKHYPIPFLVEVWSSCSFLCTGTLISGKHVIMPLNFLWLEEISLAFRRAWLPEGLAPQNLGSSRV